MQNHFDDNRIPPRAALAPVETLSPTDHEFKRLLRSARHGEEAAWDTIYRWLAPEILGFLRAGRLPDPENTLGDVFLEVARRIGDFHGDRRGFRAWVFTIARSRRVDDTRRRARRREERFDTGEYALLPSGVDVETDALVTVALEDLLAHLDVLTDDQAEVLVLRALDGLTSREVAEITGRSVGSVEQLHHRARHTLREILDRA
jgi:RNA polymerase sigma-70 factor (ECF subfamily)